AGDHRGTARLGGEAADRDLENGHAVVLAPGDERLDLVELGVRDVAGPARLGQPRGRRYVLALADLAAKQAVRQREERQQADAEVAGGRDDLPLGAALKERPVILRGDERGAAGGRRGVRGVGDLPAGEVRVPEVADLPLSDKVIEGGDGLVDRGDRVWGVQLVQ